MISSQTDAQSLIMKYQSELLKCIQRVKSSATTTVYSTLMCWGSGFRVQRLVIDPKHGQFAGREPLVSLRLGRCRLPLDVQIHYSRGILQFYIVHLFYIVYYNFTLYTCFTLHFTLYTTILHCTLILHCILQFYIVYMR